MSKTPETDKLVSELTGLQPDDQIWRLVEHARQLEEQRNKLGFVHTIQRLRDIQRIKEKD